MIGLIYGAKIFSVSLICNCRPVILQYSHYLEKKHSVLVVVFKIVLNTTPKAQYFIDMTDTKFRICLDFSRYV
jgi:hypothetical protein